MNTKYKKVSIIKKKSIIERNKNMKEKTITFTLLVVVFIFVLSFSNTYAMNNQSSGEIDIEYISGDNIEYSINESDHILVKLKHLETYNIKIDAYDYYSVINNFSKEEFLIADTLVDPSNKKVASIVIYDGLKSDQVSLQVYNSSQNLLLIANFSVDKEVGTVIRKKTKPINIDEKNELSDRLKASLNIHSAITDYNLQCTKEKKELKLLETTTSNLSMQTTSVSEFQYDAYTDSDGIIKSYEEYYFGDSFNDPDYISDDSITNIIPKELFYDLGSHFYIGKEYGFYVNTRVDTINPVDYMVDVLVFDITTKTPVDSGVNPDWGSSQIDVLFNFKYRAIDKNSRNNIWDGYDPNLTQVVFPHIHYNLIDLYLKDVSFTHSILNIDDPNASDIDYNLFQDHGNFITQGQYSFSATGLKKNSGAFTFNDLMVTIGFVPHPITRLVSSLYFGIIAGTNMLEQYNQETYINNNKAIVQDFRSTFEDQVANYGYLVKAISFERESDSGDIPIHGTTNFIKSEYKISREGSQKNNSRYVTSINAKVGRDDSDLILFFIKTGDFTELDQAVGTYSLDYNYPIKSPNISIYDIKENSITFRVFNPIDNVGPLKLLMDISDSTPNLNVGVVETGDFIDYTFHNLYPNTNYTFFAKFEDDRNNLSSYTVYIDVKTNTRLHEEPEIDILSKGYTYVNFLVTNVSSSTDALKLFAELNDSSPDIYITSLYSQDSYIVSFNGLESGAFYTFYAVFKDDDDNDLTNVSSLTIKTLGGSC